jgi:hypothetical protein
MEVRVLRMKKKSFLNHFNLSKKSGDDISIWCLDKWQIFRQGVPQYNLSFEPNSLQKCNSFLKYLRTTLTSPGFQLKLK